MRPLPGRAVLQPAAVERDAHGVLEIQRARRVHGGDLARAVADDGSRARRPSDLHSAQSAAWNAKFTGCAKSASATRDVVSSAQQLLEQRPRRRAGGSDGRTARSPERNTGSLLEQLPAHAPPLRAHAGEDEARRAAAVRARSRGR